MTVYVIEENWDNGESYDEIDNNTKAIAVSNTRDAAQKFIKERKAELIEIAKQYEKDRDEGSITFREGGLNKNDGGITFNHKTSADPFDTFNFGTDIFWWEIKEIPFIST